MVVRVSIVVLIGPIGVVVAVVIRIRSVEVTSILVVPRVVFIILVLLEVIPPHVIFSFCILLIVSI